MNIKYDVFYYCTGAILKKSYLFPNKAVFTSNKRRTLIYKLYSVIINEKTHKSFICLEKECLYIDNNQCI